MAYLVFVYGTLKSGFGNNRLLRETNSRFVGNATTEPDYTLRHGGIPFLCPTAKGKGTAVKGEVWQVDDAGLARLDSLEGHPSHYTREVIPVTPDAESWDTTLKTGHTDGMVRVHCYLMENYAKEYLPDAGAEWTGYDVPGRSRQTVAR